MKVTVEFDMDNDRERYEVFMKAEKYKSLMDDLESFFRGVLKHNSFPDEFKTRKEGLICPFEMIDYYYDVKDMNEL